MKVRKLKVRLGENSYPIVIGNNILLSLNRYLKEVGIGKKVMVITNVRIASLYLSKVRRILKKGKREVCVHLVPDSESAKSEKTLFRIYSSLLKCGFDRSGTILALGGGIVGDISGFAAATYMRGIKFINLPTTLLAQVDSAIGGKTGINLKEGKNLVGSFYQPKLVFSDISLLKTLPKTLLKDSLSEVIKYGMIKDSKLFLFLEKNIEKALSLNTQVLTKIIFGCSHIKKEIVEKDEKEVTGLRAILNYGHTFAHAFEATASFKKISHGEAVALGMIAAGLVARYMGLFGGVADERQFQLIHRAGLPTSLRKYRFNINRVIDLMRYDKKARGGKLLFILPTRVGKVNAYRNVDLGDVRKVLRSI